MKRLTIILLSLVMVLNIPITTVFADHIEENNLNYYPMNYLRIVKKDMWM